MGDWNPRKSSTAGMRLETLCLRGTVELLLRFANLSRISVSKQIENIRDRCACISMARGETHTDAEFLGYVVKSLVDHPDDVKVDRKVDEMGVLLTLMVHAEDMGQVIGRNGNTAKAIRSLLRVVGIKNNARVNLKIEEPEGGRGPGPRMERRTSVDEVVDDLKL